MSDAERPPHTCADRCIIWRPRGQAPDRELLAALARRSLAVTHCQSAFAAVGAICSVAKSPGVRVLLLVNAASLERLPEVLAAAHRYAPTAVVWEFDTVARRLHAYGAPPAAIRPAQSMPLAAAPATEPKLAITRPSRVGPPKLKLAGEGPLPPAPESEVEPPLSAGRAPTQPVRQVLTDEELAMLLSPEPIRGNG